MRRATPWAPVSAFSVAALGLFTMLARAEGQGVVAAPQDTAATERRDILSTEKKLYSQSDEELIIRDFFQDRRGGFFLDVGCAWPMKNSNTYYLEIKLGWSGIGIDALPDFADAWHKRRKRSKYLNYIVTDRSGTVETFYRSELLGISATRPPTQFGRAVKYEEIRVPTITLNQLLEQKRVSRIDFLSMDIEGAEPQALAGFDIERFRPELVCIEIKPATRDKILQYFAAHGYQQIDRYLDRDPVNYYFAPKVSGR